MNASRIQDFKERAKDTNGRKQLLALRNGEIDAMMANGAIYQEDRRRRKAYQAWQENCQWVDEINKVLDITGIHKTTRHEDWTIVYS